MVKRKHNRITAFGIKDVREMLLHTPIKVVGTFYIKSLVIGKGSINVIILSNFKAIKISHIRPFFETNLCCADRGSNRRGTGNYNETN